MIIKRYLDFVSEGYDNQFGEWVESLISDDYIKNIVNRFIEADPTIRVANAVNILGDREKLDIKNQITRYLEVGIEEKSPEIIASGEINEGALDEITISGQGMFNSFLKTLTALGKKEMSPNTDKCPDDFLIFYYYDSLEAHRVKSIFSRFKSLSRYIEFIDYGENTLNLYFGIKTNGQLEYGISYDRLIKMGEFKLSKSTIKWILSLESKSTQSLKKDIVNLIYSDILTLGLIKTDMLDFKPAYYEKVSKPVIKDRVFSFGWYGVGKWNDGEMDSDDLKNIKDNFNKWVISKKWGSKVLVGFNPKSFWLWIYIKLK